MSEYTITLHAFHGIPAGTLPAAGLGLGLLPIVAIAVAAVVGEYRPYHALRHLAVIGINLVLMLAAFGIGMGLPAHLYGEDIAELEQAAGVSDITGWAGDTGVTDITYMQDGKVDKGQILVSGNRATLRIPKHTPVRDKEINHA